MNKRNNMLGILVGEELDTVTGFIFWFLRHCRERMNRFFDDENETLALIFRNDTKKYFCLFRY
jgi:hypothetical protein